MKSKCNGFFLVDGIVFDLDTIEIKQLNNGWSLELLGKPKRVEKLWDEIFSPRLYISNLDSKGVIRIEKGRGVSADIEWCKGSGYEYDTYVSLFGEGFSLVEACIKIKNDELGFHNMMLSGISDLPTDGKKEFVDIAIEGNFELRP